MKDKIKFQYNLYAFKCLFLSEHTIIHRHVISIHLYFKYLFLCKTLGSFINHESCIMCANVVSIHRNCITLLAISALLAFDSSASQLVQIVNISKSLFAHIMQRIIWKIAFP